MSEDANYKLETLALHAGHKNELLAAICISPA